MIKICLRLIKILFLFSEITNVFIISLMKIFLLKNIRILHFKSNNRSAITLKTFQFHQKKLLKIIGFMGAFLITLLLFLPSLQISLRLMLLN